MKSLLQVKFVMGGAMAVFPIPTPTPLDVDLMENEIIALLINFNLAHPNWCDALFAGASTYTIGDDNCNETFTFITQYINSYCYYYWKECWSIQPITRKQRINWKWAQLTGVDKWIFAAIAGCCQRQQQTRS